MYNVLEKLRSGGPLTAKDKTIHEHGLISVLKQIHDDLDAAVFDAYGWPLNLTDEQILEKLVALNKVRAQEESCGIIRYLRPDFQNPTASTTPPSRPSTSPTPAKPTDSSPWAHSREPAAPPPPSSLGPTPSPNKPKPSAPPWHPNPSRSPRATRQDLHPAQPRPNRITPGNSGLPRPSPPDHQQNLHQLTRTDIGIQ